MDVGKKLHQQIRDKEKLIEEEDNDEEEAAARRANPGLRRCRPFTLVLLHSPVLTERDHIVRP